LVQEKVVFAGQTFVQSREKTSHDVKKDQMLQKKQTGNSALDSLVQ
jgi:hypothetical protein